MSDDLHRAVQAELDAHEPGPAPSFDAILDRKRTRGRRRGGAALATTALAVAAVAFVPSALTDAGSGARGEAAQDIPVTAPTGGDLPCETPRSFIYGLATSTGGAPTPEEAAERFAARPGAEPGYAEQTWRRTATNPNGEVVVQGQTARLTVLNGSDGTWLVTGGSACPQVTTQPMHRTYTVQPSVRAVGNSRLDEERNACFRAARRGGRRPGRERARHLPGRGASWAGRAVRAVHHRRARPVRPRAGPQG